jgi:uncharacterized protein (TIGR02001 family)
MMKKQWLIAAGLLGMAGAAQAGLSSTVAFTTDYDFRGISQTAKYPALSASLDYAWDTGFSVGAWASNLDFGGYADEKIELDLYGGYSKSFSNGWSYTVNGIYYTYPGAHIALAPGDYSGPSLNFWEVNVGGGYKNFSMKYWYAGDFSHYESILNDAGFDGKSAKAWYLEANWSQPLPKDITLALHAGASRGKYWDNLGLLAGAGSTKYEDYSVGFSKTISGYTFTAKFIYPKVNNAYLLKEGPFANTQRGVLSVATTF